MKQSKYLYCNKCKIAFERLGGIPCCPRCLSCSAKDLEPIGESFKEVKKLTFNPSRRYW